MSVTNHLLFGRFLTAGFLVVLAAVVLSLVAARSGKLTGSAGAEGEGADSAEASSGLFAERPVALLDTFDGKQIHPWPSSMSLQEENLVKIHAHTSPSDMSPAMPDLELLVAERIEGAVKARLEVHYPRGNGARPFRGTDHDRVLIPADGSFEVIEDRRWVIHQDSDYLAEIREAGFFGGNAVLTYVIADSGETQKIRFRIGGENPVDQKCEKFIHSFAETKSGKKLDFMDAIARHESKAKNRDRVYYNQFLHLGTHPQDGGFPVWNNDGGTTPGGYGVFQVTGTAEDARADIRRDTIWNWQSNVEAAFRIMTHQIKGSLAERYFNRIKNGISQAQRLFAQCPPPKISAAGETFTARQAVWITAYNGWGGLLRNRFIFDKDKPCGLGPNKRWQWNPPVKPSGKTYLQLVAEEMKNSETMAQRE